MSNGVEVLVKDKSAEAKQEQRKVKFMHLTSTKAPHHHISSSPLPTQTLLSSAVATFLNRQHMSAMFPLHQFMQHNYIIKTCMTTYTYLTTVVQNKRSAISTFETIVSVVTTESLTNLYATDVMSDLNPTKTKYMEVKTTIQPSAPNKMFVSDFPKIEKRIDDQDVDKIDSFDLIQPSEPGHPCTSSCSCSHSKTEGLKTKYTNNIHDHSMSGSTKYGMKFSKYGATKVDLKPTKTESLQNNSQYGPYEYESSQSAPTDRIVEKYTEVINDSDEKESNSVEDSELLTNEQALAPPKTNKPSNNKILDKTKPEKQQKPNKNKVLVADLLKLGSLGIKGLSQFAPVFEKMTAGFIKRQDTNKTTTTTTTIKPVMKLTPYHVNKRFDTDIESKHSNFPIYIPVDELETSESQIIFTNATLHQNLAWATEHKQPKSRIVPPKMVHESPLVNGGIPISPGEIITANSDVIVGKPAVGGPLTLAASGFKLHNPVNPPPIDSFVSGNEHYLVKENSPINDQVSGSKDDDSYDLRPPELPKQKPQPNRNMPRPTTTQTLNNHNAQSLYKLHRPPPNLSHDHNMMKTEHLKSTSAVLGNHGRPVFLDYIPSLAQTNNSPLTKQHVDFKPVNEENNEDTLDNSPSSSEIVNTQVTTDGEYASSNSDTITNPFLVDIQPSRVANVLIPHGSATAIVFAGSSEPHKTGDYIDDPLPYPEPGYFGSFSIDAPQMTNVHNVRPINKPFILKPHEHSQSTYKPNLSPTFKDPQYRNDLKFIWKDSKKPEDYNSIPPPTSIQETHVRVGPHITAYNPDIYNPNNGDFEKYLHISNDNQYKDGKKVIDKEYENYLAVPPPPPPKKNYNPENQFDKNKPYNQRPIVHTKPVQDMSMFLNIQHPVPKAPTQEPLPPKVTSEIYFAAQAPNNKATPTYTIHIPPAPPTYGSNYRQGPSNSKQPVVSNFNSGQNSNSFSVVSSPNFTNKTIFSNNINDKDNTYTVTLNTAANIANNVGETGQVIGTSVPVTVDTSSNIGQLNTDIPIGTNFAIKVEDRPSPFERNNLQSNGNPPVVYDDHVRAPIQVTIEDNRWNQSSSEKDGSKIETTIIGQNYYDQNYANKQNKIKDSLMPSITPSLNSHANFPMTNDYTTSSYTYDNVKPVTEYADNVKSSDQKRPAKLIPNIPTNSHGWYSSILQNEDVLNNINNIKVEGTTRKIIPLSHDYNKDSVPDFGQKISSIGKPPSGLWPQNSPTVPNNFNIGKPFTKAIEKPYSSVAPLTTEPYNPDYIPSNFGIVKQPAYDIHIRDNSDETTTTNAEKSTEKVKPVYENSEEIYDGEEESYTNSESDGEVSLESMKVPVITTSSEEISTLNVSKSTTELNLLKEEVLRLPNDLQEEKKVELEEFNPGTQTEKPFGSNNQTNTFQSNTIKPIYSHMKPRPFTVNLATLDHQLQQPHWQINQLMVNSTNVSYEENLDLNIGEEMGSSTTTKAPSTHKIPQRNTDYGNKYKRPQKPVYSSSYDNTRLVNDSNIITSTVHIKDKIPLIVEEVTKKSMLPTDTATGFHINHSSSEIIDLSPPPPTIDYSFKPSTNDETIMGMSPPPPRTQSPRLPPRSPPTPRPILSYKTPSPYKTKPPRTLPPRLPPTQRPIRRPISRDEVSTYRPAYDTLNGAKRPTFNRDQPSSHLLPPPREIPSRVITPMNELPGPTISVPVVPNIVFPTPISSGWLTSSGVDFSSSFDFGPTFVHFPEISKPSKTPELNDTSSTTENSYSYEIVSSSEHVVDVTSEKPLIDVKIVNSKETSTEATTKLLGDKQNLSDAVISESSHEESTTDKIKVVSLGNKNVVRKPYPVRNDEKKSSTSKQKLPSKPISIIRPTRTLNRPEILYPTRHTSIRKFARPIPTRSATTISSSIIESSEPSVEEEFIQPTEVLEDSVISNTLLPERIRSTEKLPASIITPSLNEIKTNVQPTHHAGNEVKISDEIIPTRTEFRTTVVTLTKTLSEPPRTVSSIGYVNLTHTLTVTHTKTSLVSKSEGAVTQTLVLTNTHTSTIVDVVTEVHTQVQPTTIIETVTKHIPIQVEPTPVQEITSKTKVALDDITMSSEEDNLIIKDSETTENIQKLETDNDGENDTFFVVMNKSQNGGKVPPPSTDQETGEYDITRNEQVGTNGVSQVMLGEILIAGAPFLETTHVVNPSGVSYGKECQPDCKASRNERCQRIDGIMKCVCRAGFARMFPDRPCKPAYTYSVRLTLGTKGNERLLFHESLSDNSSKQYHALAVATHEGINRMVMQSDLRDVFHGVHITGFHPAEIYDNRGTFQGVMSDFYVQLSDNAHESRLKEVIEKYLRNNNYSLGGTDLHAAGEMVERLNVSDFDECTSGQFHDCSEHAQCFNLRGTYTCSCLEGFADLSVNNLYPGRICSAEPVGCELCNYHGACYSRDDRRVLCECFQWYAGSTCHINLKVVLISLVVLGALLTVVLTVCAVVACKRPRPPPRSIVTCIQGMPSLHQGAMPSKQRADRRALISDRGDSGDASSVQNASLPYMPAAKRSSSGGKKCVISEPPAHDPPPPPAPAVMIPRARLHPHHSDSRENIARKRSLELSSEAKLISYLESGAANINDEMRRKHSIESSFSANKDRHNKQGALVSAGFKVSTTVRPDEAMMKEDRDDLSSVNKNELEAELAHFDSLRKSYSQEDLSEWTDAERRIGELTLSEARSVGGTLPASTGRAASSTRLTHQEANTMAERDLGSTFLLPHVHLYKPDLTSDVSEFDSL